MWDRLYFRPVRLQSDLTYYFATSEQVPSAVGLGVLMNKDNTVRQAGGFIVQLMPFAEESTISRLEENIKKINSVTDLLEEGHTPESLLEKAWMVLIWRSMTRFPQSFTVTAAGRE